MIDAYWQLFLVMFVAVDVNPGSSEEHSQFRKVLLESNLKMERCFTATLVVKP